MSPSRNIQLKLHEIADPRVLMVDDHAPNLFAFEAILAMPGVELVAARSGAEAMRHLLDGDFAAILLDINMPDLDGLQTARLIRERERTRDIPIIFISAYAADQTRVIEGYATGAVDYIVKPVAPDILRSKVSVFVELYRKKQQVEWQASRLREANVQLQREANERREAEADALFEREERQRVTLQCIADGVITTDARGRVTHANAVAERLVRKRSALTRGMPLATMLPLAPPAGGESLNRMVEDCLATDQRFEGAGLTALAVEGEPCFVEYSIAPVHDRRGAVIGTVCIVKDVSAREATARERERLLAAEQAARHDAEAANSMKDEFLGIVSHELRTPLSAIVGWVALLERRPDDVALVPRAVDTIRRSATAQAKLIDDLLDTSRILSGKLALTMEPVDFASTIQAAVDGLRPLAQTRGIAMELEALPPTVMVSGDRDRLSQVLSNILSNALKFTPAGGAVRIRVACANQRATVTISDTGEGIAPAFLPHVFDRFRQANIGTTRRHGGLGLGMAIAKQIIVLHGGEITARSEGEGRGAAFSVTLKLHDATLMSRMAAAPDVTTTGEGDDGYQLHGLRVLAVEDDADTRGLLRAVLHAAGAEVRVAASASEAKQVMESWLPAVLLSDISMPDEDGYALIAWLRARTPAAGGMIPAAALTALASPTDAKRACESGFQRHLAKPIEPSMLLKAVAEMVNPNE